MKTLIHISRHSSSPHCHRTHGQLFKTVSQKPNGYLNPAFVKSFSPQTYSPSTFPHVLSLQIVIQTRRVIHLQILSLIHYKNSKQKLQNISLLSSFSPTPQHNLILVHINETALIVLPADSSIPVSIRSMVNTPFKMYARSYHLTGQNYH